jgi:SRSO17 transposase
MGTVLGRPAPAQKRGVVNVPATALVPMIKHLRRFLYPYLPLFGRSENRTNADLTIQGLLSNLPRKSVEPLAEFHDVPRRALQRFVGAGSWRYGPLIDLLCEQVARELGRPDGVLIIDPTSFPKKGTDSVGVARQWCGRLGKVENCQVGVFLSYASSEGHTLIDERLYLPEEWCGDAARRERCYVPEGVVFRTSWELADEMLAARAPSIPHAWILGDDEFGRPGEFRDRLDTRGERYMLDVPSTTSVKVLGQVPHPGRRPNPVHASAWAEALEPKDWTLYTVRDGAKGPLQVEAAWTRVLTNRAHEGRKPNWSREEILLVIRTVGQCVETKYLLTNAGVDCPLEEKVRAACTRWRVEDCFERAKGEVGLAQYEVRSWTGWHHHMTLSLIALWCLVLEHRQMRRPFFPLHRSAGALLHWRVPARPRSGRRRAGGQDQPETDAERTGADSTLGPSARTARGQANSASVVSYDVAQ